MPRTRSRPKTEKKFQNAVLELVARDGCGDLGINAIAQLAGADKVLIYRYFGDFEGLLQMVADSRQWLPTCEDFLSELPYRRMNRVQTDAQSLLRDIHAGFVEYVRQDACIHQLLRWRHASMDPLCKQFSNDWQTWWKSLPAFLARGLSSEQRGLWQQACAICALMIEAELCGEAVDKRCLDRMADGLAAIQIEQSSERTFPVEESLPTNLL